MAIWGTICAFFVALGRLVPFLTKLLDLVIKSREDAAKRADEKRKIDADQKMALDEARIRQAEQEADAGLR